MVTLEDGGICFTDVYHKPTDTHQYLNKKSCHPPHVKKAISYSQALRLRRICYSDKVLDDHLCQLKGIFVNRGYSENSLEGQISRVRNLNC